MLTVERLRELLRYDPETGVFTWRMDRGKGVRAGDLVGRGPPNAKYVRMTLLNRKHLAHRLAWLYVHGEWPPQMIDHINGDGRDNRLSNLRLADRSQNGANTKRRSTNKSGAKGVFFCASTGRWHAYITHQRKRHHLGCFTSLEEAAAAYAQAAENRFGSFARQDMSEACSWASDIAGATAESCAAVASQDLENANG